MTTAGGLVFVGTPEDEFKALDDETGEELWSFQTGSGVVGQPITWEQDGEQYVSVISGWGGAVPLWGGEAPRSRRFSSALWSLLSADGASGRSQRRVQCHRGANERLQRIFINLVVLMEIDGTPGVAFEAGVEEV